MQDKPLAYRAYQELADYYAQHIDTKPHNAYYDRPAMLGLLPPIEGKSVLDAGCGPGAYSEQLVNRGARVVGCDVSERMLELAEQRLRPHLDNGSVKLMLVDLTQPLSMFATNQFDVVCAPLCLDYIEDWVALFGEFKRILKENGCFVFSCGHPSFDAEYFDTDNYFNVEQVQCEWTGFGKKVQMPSFRRSLEQVLMPVIDAGLAIERVLEPQPTEAFRQADPVRFDQLMHRPAFICVRAVKAN